MKTILILFAVLISAPVVWGQTVNNGDLEEWTDFAGYRNPTGWDTPNAGLSLFGISSVFREETNVFAGTYSAKLVTTTVPLAGIDAPAALSNGILEVNISDPLASNVFGGALVSGKPDALTAWYDYAPVGGDSMTLRVQMLNIDGLDTTVIAEGEFFDDTNTGGTWEQLSIDLNYTTTDDPELIQILARSTRASGDANDGSTLYIDDFKLTGITGTDDLAALDIGVDFYPNPASTAFNVSNPWKQNVRMELRSVLGQNAADFLLTPGDNSLDVSKLPTGLYVYSISSDEEQLKEGKLEILR